MSNPNLPELKKQKKDALQRLSIFLDILVDSNDEKQTSKASKLCYWLNDWTTFLDFETQFTPLSLRRYKRGEIIKVHLGFNVGSEEGGLHYALVLDKNNAKSSPVITIIPFTSVKPQTDIGKLKRGSIFLGDEIYTSLNTKVITTNKYLEDEFDFIQGHIKQMGSNMSFLEQDRIKQKIEQIKSDLNLLNRMRKEVLNMKKGSIALVNQITTISKIRIYDPKTDHDILSNIKLSNEKLDLIDAEIRKNFTNI